MQRRMNSGLDYKFGCDVKIRSIHEEEVSNMCIGSLITWCNPNWDVKFSIAFPSCISLTKPVV